MTPDTQPQRRRPIEAIEKRTARSAECERRVRRALSKLVNTGAPFTVENLCDLAGVGKTFIYDKRRPELTAAILAARDTARAVEAECAEQRYDGAELVWRERAINAESLAKSLRAALKERDTRIADLTGQLYDPDGNHLIDQLTELRHMIETLSHKLRLTEIENGKLHRSLDAARMNVKRERERNVAHLGIVH